MNFLSYNIEDEILKINQTQPLNFDLDWYSSRKIIHTIYDIPKDIHIKVYPFHGIHIEDKEHKDYALEYRCPVLANRQSQVDHLIAQGGDASRIFSSGGLFPMYRRTQHIERAQNAQGTLFFLSHSSQQMKTDTNLNELILQLKKLPTKFYPVNICIYWLDFETLDYTHLIKNGFNVYTAGHCNDPEFVDNFYEILRHHKYAATNAHTGSNLFYAVEMGIPFFLYARNTYQPHAPTKDFYKAGIPLSRSLERINFATHFTATHFPQEPTTKISPELKQICDKMLGLDYQTPKHIIREAIISYSTNRSITGKR